MMYVDTSMVVTALDPSDPVRSKAAAVLLEGGRDKVVSELFLVELAAAVSRNASLLGAVQSEDARPATVLVAYLVYLMSKYHLRLLSPSGGMVPTPLGEVRGEAAASLGVAAELKLRSLDLLHVSYLLSLRERGYSVDTLLTSDEDFLKAEPLLERQGVKLVVQKSPR